MHPASFLGFLFAVSTAASARALAREGVALSAHAIDAVTGAPIAAAAMMLERAGNEEPVGVATTDKNGRSTIPSIAPGKYRLIISAPGYDDVEREVLVGEATDALDFGRIGLKRHAGEIVVTGTRTGPEIGIGVNSYAIENNALAQSGSALAAMKALPGITVEREGEILLRGSDRVTILVDGKPSGLTGVGNQRGLETLPAANIARIEVINNPSARYAAHGSAGIVNIIMREQRKSGLSGHVGIKGGFGALERRKPDLPTQLGSFDWTPKISPYFNLRYGGDRADYSLQGEFLLQRKLPNNEFTTRFYDDGRRIVSQVPENRKQDQYILKGGTDQRLSDNDTLTVNFNFDLENHLDVAQVPFIEETTNTLTRYWFWRENEQTGHASATVNYRHDFPEAGHHISLRAEFIRGWEDETYRLNEVSPVRIGTDQTTIVAKENTLPISIDYVRPMSNGRIEVGAKAQYRWIPVTYDVVRGVGSIIYPGLGDHSNWKEDIYAGYFNLVRETAGFTIEAGLRAEHTSVAYKLDPVNIYYPLNDSYSYFRLFPNVRLTRALGPDTDLSLFYNTRVDRPGEPELRVFPKYDDPELLKVGNPYLRPQFTTAYEVSLRQDWGRLTGSLAAYHRRIKNAFQRIYAIDESNTTYDIVNKIYQNTGRATNSGVELVAAWKAQPGLKFNGSFNAFRIRRPATTITLLFPYVRDIALDASRDFTWDGKIGMEASLGKSTTAQVNGTYYAQREIAQGSQAARGTLDVGITRKLRGDKIKASLTATDIFNSFGTKTTVRGIGFDAVYENYYETQAIMLSLELKI